MDQQQHIRYRNPFRDPFVTELIDDPVRYRQMFSERILIGETLEVFQRSNVILLGPQGSGKSMILNLIRFSVLAEYFGSHGSLPDTLEPIDPFLGISVNLQRANFHIFGRRSVSKTILKDHDPEVDLICAADFLVHYLFGEFLRALSFLQDPRAQHMLEWLGLDKSVLADEEVYKTMAQWDSWNSYYHACSSVEALQEKCQKRLSTWRSFLVANIDKVPEEVWTSKATLEEPLHAMGNLLGSLRKSGGGLLPLFVVVDQYEVLPDLNPLYGSRLQRVVNSLVKARDPVVFYKLGARTHDWGRELRVWGADSRIEVHRDYSVVNLADLLMRSEDGGGWLFPGFARDVAEKRLSGEGFDTGTDNIPQRIFGPYSAEKEAYLYVRGKAHARRLMGSLPIKLEAEALRLLEEGSSPLDLRLAGAWVCQKLQAGVSHSKIIAELKGLPWKWKWWRKERIEPALIQIASIANQKKRYFGWQSILMLSGFNITAFLLICKEIWDVAAKMGLDPLSREPLDPAIQTEGIFAASQKWRARDRAERPGGSQRYALLSRLGPAIRDLVVEDLAISNPGHTGFSIREPDLAATRAGKKVSIFLDQSVNWAIFEERLHTSKRREGATRRKYYLHPLLSPSFGIPFKRVKEPFYAEIDEVYAWIFKGAPVVFRGRESLRRRARPGQMNFFGEEDD